MEDKIMMNEEVMENAMDVAEIPATGNGLKFLKTLGVIALVVGAGVIIHKVVTKHKAQKEQEEGTYECAEYSEVEDQK